MAQTLLNSVNEVLKRVHVIQGDSGALTTLTDSARQGYIDVAVQVINEGMEELYSTVGRPLPKELASSTITLATGDRDYALAADLVSMHWPLIDRTNNQFIHEYPGGYLGLLELDPEQDDTGLPRFGVISPEDGELYLDTAPTSSENGRTYTYQYDKDISMSVAADTVPFGDAVFRAMVPVWSQLWQREERSKFDAELFRANLGRAGRLLTQKPLRSSWSPR